MGQRVSCRPFGVREEPRRNLDARRASFLTASTDYALTRPGYPIPAIEWVVGRGPKRVIDLGCGPGNLTSLLAELGHIAIGVDPSLEMLRGTVVNRVLTTGGSAEQIPLRTGCADVVTAATAFHWFDHERSVPEMRRILRMPGRVGLFTNFRDESVEWISSLSEIIGSETAMAVTLGGAAGIEQEFTRRLEGTGHFKSTEYRTFDYQQELCEDKLVGLVRSRSYVAILPDGQREELLADVRRLCREHPQLKGRETFSMTYKTHVFRAQAA